MIQRSSRASPGGSSALRTRWTRRSELVTVPSLSAHEAAESAVRASAASQNDGTVGGYTHPVSEVEYVRTFAQVAQVQLRSVLDALTEQVDKLGEVPKLSEGGEPPKELPRQRASDPATQPTSVLP